MAIRTRKNVYSLPAGDQTIDWYRRAVARLLQKPSSDPTSWVYMAAVHGTSNPVPPPAQGFWDQCQHQSWYFLSWHRGYITAFEAVIARTVQELGGPADWALPYWDYTQSLQRNPRARLMPASFFNARLPNGSANALWSRRRAVTGGNFGLTDPMVSRGALNVADFTRAQPGAPVGFGGPITGFHPGGGTSGAIENIPHNVVHVQIGGLMGNPNTAALDPIFWLHHCNIDRLWEMWRTNHADSADPRWLTGVSFRMHNGTGQAYTYTSRDMLDSTRVLHGYRYDDVAPVIRAGINEGVEGGLESVATESEEQRQPELAGANEGPIDITSGNRTIVSLAGGPVLESAVASAAPSKVYLNLENVTGRGENGNFYVYVDMPSDEREPTFVGTLSTFGVERASKSDDAHGGSGISIVFDISEVAAELGINAGTLDQLRVTFEPVPPPEQTVLESAGADGGTDDGEGDLPEAVLEFLGPQLESASGQSVQVGRVSLFVE